MLKFFFLALVFISSQRISALEVCLFEGCKCQADRFSSSYSISCTNNQALGFFPKRDPELINEKKISSFYLTNYRFEVIPDEILRDLEIENLLIVNNQDFKNLTENAFKNIKSLRMLIFTSSSIMNVEKDSFKWINSTLSLLSFNEALFSSDELSAFFSDIGFLSSLEKLYITKNNKLNTVDLDWFQNFPSLKILRLDYNQIENLTKSSVMDSPFELNELSLKGNQLKDGSVLQYLFNSSKKSLSKLVLEHNSIETFSGISFFENLNWIDLNSNGIKELEKVDFENLTYLKHLQLSSNKIESIEKDAFENLISLTYLNLADNFLSKIPNIFNLSSLDNFDVSHQNGKLVNLPDYSFKKKIDKNSKGFIYLNLNGNDIHSYGNKTFCSSLYSNNLAFDISFNSMKYFAKNSNKCIFKQIKTKFYLNLYESQTIVNYREVCNCNLVKFFKIININFSGVCDEILPSNFCDDENIKDNCWNMPEFSCPKIFL